MVVCPQIATFADCNVIERTRKCSAFQAICDCAKIFGHDHLKSRRARKFRCKSKRIRRLAQPKQVAKKFDEDKIEPRNLASEARESCASPRIQMLAYPKVRKLVSTREAIKAMDDKKWQERFEKLIQRSLLTNYSRLAHVHLPSKKVRDKWTRDDWVRHCEWLRERALPKSSLKTLPSKRKKVPLSELMDSIHALSKPRNPRTKFRRRCGYESTVKETALIYNPSPRVLVLAQPKHPKDDDDDEDEADPFQVKKTALNPVLTTRVKQLSKPKPAPKLDESSDLTPFGVKKRALEAPTSQRIDELAKPKEKEDEDGEKPLVNPKALKAKASERIKKLAEPRRPAEKV